MKDNFKNTIKDTKELLTSIPEDFKHSFRTMTIIGKLILFPCAVCLVIVTLLIIVPFSLGAGLLQSIEYNKIFFK